MRLFLIGTLLLLVFSMESQNETAKWYFGNKVALDFMTDPPTVLVNSAMTETDGTSTVSDALGNLELYTNGKTIWNNQHNIIANGTGLLAANAQQQALIVKQPGSSRLFYVFTLDHGGPSGFRYSIVDMGLASGQGSVTVKNATLYPSSLECQAAVKHANGQDVWIISHPYGTNYFTSYLLTAAGLSVTPVTSTVGPVIIGGSRSTIKISPAGRQLGWSHSSPDFHALLDFDPGSGLVSNYVKISDLQGFSCEFSPDGSKLYGCYPGGSGYILQWDLCSNIDTVMAASEYTVRQGSGMYTLQLAKNGKIYGAVPGLDSLSVIHTPNDLGSLCGYSHAIQPVGSGIIYGGLPNFPSFYFSETQGVFSYTINNQSCGAATFSAPCISKQTKYTGVTWVFGDPGSAVNSATTSVAQHTFSSPGTYVVKLALQTAGGADTLKQTINYPFALPQLSVAGSTQACVGDNVVLNASGANTFTWAGQVSTASLAVTASATTIFTLSGTDSTGCVASRLFTLTVNECIGLNESGELVAVTIFPNPARDELIVESDVVLQISIFNQLGSVVYKTATTSGSNRLNIEALNRGMYFVLLKSGKNGKILKLIKE